MTALVVKADDAIVERLRAANAQLSAAASISHVKAVVDIAAAAEVFARRQKLSDEAIGYAHALRIDALTRLGEMLAQAPKQAGARGTGANQYRGGVPVENPTPTLRDHGIDKKTSMVAQRLAKLPPKEREAVRERHVTLTQGDLYT